MLTRDKNLTESGNDGIPNNWWSEIKKINPKVKDNSY